ncbi:MAG: putative TetR family transcriptional regulator, partial [Solirubrobacterales bacterium]|nr:putative TetR family transcriptional regulator [Solirubrobacterales bacterium]
MTPRRPVIEWEPASGRSAPVSGKGGRTRQQVLDSAVETFGRRGFQQTTMHDIAATAGVASGTAYQYFSDKADVLRCLLADLED